MLHIRRVEHLARRLGVAIELLERVAETRDRWCEDRLILDPARPKPRNVLCIRGPLREIQSRILRAVLLPALPASQFSHGGIRGRHIKSNIRPHLRSAFVFTSDISDFYPSVSHNRVYRLFVGRFECAPDVARFLTRLCTHNQHLALGLITSPILADQVMHPIDDRIGQACQQAGLIYTRFVDDLTISGGYDLKRSGFSSLVERIAGEHGFALNPRKHQFGRLDEGTPITKIRSNRGHPDVRREYLAELERQLADARRLAVGDHFEGPYYTEGQIWGRVQFVCWINPGRRRSLEHQYRMIRWDKVREAAESRNLTISRKSFEKR